MPITNQTLNNNLYDNLYAQGYSPDPLDSMGKEAQIKDADVFRLNYKDDDGATSQVWMAVVDGALTIWLDNKFTKTKKFENFNKFWKNWSQQQTLRWEITNRDRLVTDMKKRTDMKNQEDQLNEGYYALGKQRSYSDSVPTVKLIIQHTRQLEEGEQRFRNIAKIFVENAGGERFLLPTNRPGLARVFARHIAEGGTPYDDKGRHITTLVEEYNKMAGFVRATRNGQFNESALKLVNEGLLHYNNLRMTLQGMTSHRGYNKYFESYTPVLNEEADDDTTLNELFVEETLDPRIESVMPILKRLSKNITEMNEVNELAEWAESITEVEDETTKTLAEPAVDMLESEVDSDIAKVEAGTANIKSDAEKAASVPPGQLVKEAPGAMTLKHNQNTEKSNLAAFDLDEEEDMEEGLSDVYKNVRKKFRQSALGRAREHGYSLNFNEGPADEPVEPDMDADDKRFDDIDEELENEVLDTVSDDLMGDLDENLDADQKRAKQLGPTTPVGKNEKNLRGMAVGTSESIRATLDKITEMDKSQPSSDRGGESSGNPYAKGGKATPAKAKDAAKTAGKVLNKAMDKAHKKDVKEGQDDLNAILRIVRK